LAVDLVAPTVAKTAGYLVVPKAERSVERKAGDLAALTAVRWVFLKVGLSVDRMVATRADSRVGNSADHLAGRWVDRWAEKRAAPWDVLKAGSRAGDLVEHWADRSE